MSQLPNNSDSQKPDANSQYQTSIPVNQNNIQGNNVRAVQGNNNKAFLGDITVTNTNNYYGLLNRDLKPLTFFGKFLIYFQVVFFLLGTLIFWLLFGFFTDYSFPYAESIELLLCCFRGKIASKVNQFQEQAQKTEFISQLDNYDQVKKLNKLESQIWLYEAIIEKLSTNGNGSYERIARTLVALKQKRGLVENQLESRRPKKYKTLSNIQKFFQLFTVSEEEKDFIKIDNLLNSMNNIQSSEIIFIEELIEKISKDIKAKENKIKPRRLILIYKIEKLIKKISLLNIYKNDGNEDIKKFQEIINYLRSQRDVAVENFDKKSIEYDLKLLEIDKLSKHIDQFKREISNLSSEISSSHEKIDRYNDIMTSQENQISLLNQELDIKLHKKNDLEQEQEILNRKIEQLLQEQHYYKDKIEKLNQQIRKQSQEISRKLRGGEYIGTLTNENYHYHRDCNHWKSLALEYMMYDNKREIYSYTNPSIFLKNGLKPCSRCMELSKKKSGR